VEIRYLGFEQRQDSRAYLERGWEGEHELTAADVRAYAGVQAETQQKSPWRNFGI
jgi:hypothetical protein